MYSSWSIVLENQELFKLFFEFWKPSLRWKYLPLKKWYIYLSLSSELVSKRLIYQLGVEWGPQSRNDDCLQQHESTERTGKRNGKDHVGNSKLVRKFVDIFSYWEMKCVSSHCDLADCSVLQQQNEADVTFKAVWFPALSQKNPCNFHLALSGHLLWKAAPKYGVRHLWEDKGGEKALKLLAWVEPQAELQPASTIGHERVILDG